MAHVSSGRAQRRITIKAKLLGSAGVLLALMLLIGTLGITSVSSIKDKSDTVLGQAVTPLVDLGFASSALNDTRQQQTTYRNAKTPAARGEIGAKVKANDAEVAKRLAAVQKSVSTQAERDAMAKVDHDLSVYYGMRDKLFKMVDTAADPATDTAIADYSRNIVSPAITVALADFNTLYTAKHTLAKHKQAEIADAAASNRTRSILLLVFAFIAGLGLMLWVSRGIERSVKLILERLASLRDHCANELNKALNAMAQGDLTVAVDATTPGLRRTSNDEIGDVAEAVGQIRDSTVASVAAYNETRGALSQMIGVLSTSASVVAGSSGEMASTSDEVGRAIGEIAGGIGEVAKGSERQVRAIESARAQTNEMAIATDESATNAREAAEVAQETSRLADEGAQAVGKATGAMESVRTSSTEATQAIRELGAKSEQISGIVSTITGLAEQTNLLALNAAIEAARAGEQGKGFAVVAEEVRKLAEESQTAAASIADLIGQIQHETQRAVEVVENGAQRTSEGAATVEQARESFVRIRASVADMSDRVEQIASTIGQVADASQRVQDDFAEVAAVAEQSSASAEQVSASTEQTSASTQQIAASAQELAGTSEELAQLVARFKLAGVA
ncbi:methyl-accepting chemotaxis protein [Solirubrobacter ginsenosidimutans]|uniref:Methyl-accepting chemotaxis protein n=1 Tax=Solirubrobacter ginsenosidimutans TaxID=490573 RepID=A0A9X3N417_9ACTN|nr:methyl-accepting chemotaxis protein [Solirubrobacter ginsenosidimutans]MDA0166886.1 methyl-accepting chemotaxis protein [Solirubrobacter ginsenosidimutans]